MTNSDKVKENFNQFHLEFMLLRSKYGLNRTCLLNMDTGLEYKICGEGIDPEDPECLIFGFSPTGEHNCPKCMDNQHDNEEDNA